VPAPPPEDEAVEEPLPQAGLDSSDDDHDPDPEYVDRPLEDVVLAAVRAAIPTAFLARLAHTDGGSPRGAPADGRAQC